jgi:hypothetical protein
VYAASFYSISHLALSDNFKSAYDFGLSTRDANVRNIIRLTDKSTITPVPGLGFKATAQYQ